MYTYQEALTQANEIIELLRPHCSKINLAGSIRRKKAMVKDIEIVCIPLPYEVGLFESGIATVVNRWDKVKGELPCKYTQRILPSGIRLDIFIATEENYGFLLAIRTGSAEYSHRVLGYAWTSHGFKSIEGILTKAGNPIPTPTEQEFFNLVKLPFIAPELREVK